jgi:hypothetical protein
MVDSWRFLGQGEMFFQGGGSCMKGRNKDIIIVVTWAVLALPGITGAAIVDFTIDLDGAQAGTGSAATGTGTATIDTGINSLSWSITFAASALTNGPASVTAAYFHVGPAGVNGPAITPPGNVAGAGTSPITGSATITDTNETRLLSACIYFEIQTTAFPAGEIRGQLIPEKVTLPAKKDNRINDYKSPTDPNSNGSGDYIHAGTNSSGAKKRGLIMFDVAGSGIPVGSSITSAKLRLHVSRSDTDPNIIELHRLLNDWGEGTSHAPGAEGQGAPATPGDATWWHTFYPDSFWTNVGGDFEPSASAREAVNKAGFYSWASEEVVNDVQGWLDKPSDNFGWLLLGMEDVTRSVKIFDSRTNTDPNVANHPALIVQYTAPCPFALAGDVNSDCKVNSFDLAVMAFNWLIDCDNLPLDPACVPKP